MGTVITANRLADGLVVFLGATDWVTSIDQAALLDTAAEPDAVARARQDEARDIVVEAYPIDVVETGGTIVPKALREAIRARGPTVRPDLAAQQQR